MPTDVHPGPPRRSWLPALAAAAASGAAMGALFPALGWDALAWVAVVPLLIVVARAHGFWRALWPGYLAGALFFAVSCPWIAATVHNYGDLGPATAAVVFLLFLALMGSYLALFAVVGYAIGRALGHRLLPLPFVWIAVEWLRTYTPMGGFPWNLLGYSQYQHLGFMLVAPVAGVYGASFLIVLANTLVAALLLRWHDGGASAWSWGPAAAGLALILGFATLPYHPPAALGAAAPGALRARLVQPDTALDAEWTTASLAAFLNAQLKLSAPSAPGASPVALVLWPEQPAPLNYSLQPDFQRMTMDLLNQTHAAFLFGEISYPLDARGLPDLRQPRNSALLVNPDGTTGPRYDKVHLVPFGEYVPLPQWFQRFAGVGKLVQDVGDFVPGRRLVLFPLGGHRFATMICYESIFPALARREVAMGAEWLVNQSDDSWYGTSSAAAQGLMMAQVRAMENRRWLLRVTDNGLTAVVDPYGRVTAELPRFRAAALETSFAPATALTFYTRHGDWIAWLCTAIMAALAFAGWLRRWRWHAGRDATS